jgi:hypothetical protein
VLRARVPGVRLFLIFALCEQSKPQAAIRSKSFLWLDLDLTGGGRASWLQVWRVERTAIFTENHDSS